MASKNKVEVRIAGKSYTLVGIESDEYIQKVALYIDRKMNEIMKMNHTLSTSMAAVLTAINVADDFFKVSNSEKSLQKELEQAAEELSQLKEETERLSEEKSDLEDRNSSLQLELAKREAELAEVRNMLDLATKSRM